jgi:hypothetical protein
MLYTFSFLCFISVFHLSVFFAPAHNEWHVSRDYSLTFSLLFGILLEDLIKVGSCIREDAPGLKSALSSLMYAAV